jgi:glutathione synthase/RimK-type ligase-like ATP-grasp enzyme
MEGESVSFRITTFHSAEPLLRLNPSADRIRAENAAMEIECVHGERRMKLVCVVDNSLPPDAIAMSKRVAKFLQLTDYKWHVPANLTQARLQIGPLIGILANPVWDKDKGTLRKSQQLEGLKRLVQVGQERKSICFLFGIDDVDMRAGTIRGFVLQGDKWHKRVMPMPDVIYDQLVSRKIERDPAFKEKRKALSSRYGDRFFNDGFFDKWQVYEWLYEDQRMKAHLPHTQRHTSISSAISFINLHPVTFLKPLHGSLGLGISRFVKGKDGSIVYETKNTTTSVTHGKSSNAVSALKTFRTRLKSRPYIWQEGLSLATYHGRPVDIRILMQRDHSGEWKRTKMFARVAKSGDFTSNLTGGGDAMPVDQALTECLPKAEQRARAKSQIRRVSLDTVHALEQGSGRTFGELGIDLGLDTTGKVWIIEVNSKPRKTPTTERGRQDLVDLSFERPIRYAIYLATSSRS